MWASYSHSQYLLNFFKIFNQSIKSISWDFSQVHWYRKWIYYLKILLKLTLTTYITYFSWNKFNYEILINYLSTFNALFLPHFKPQKRVGVMVPVRFRSSFPSGMIPPFLFNPALILSITLTEIEKSFYWF